MTEIQEYCTVPEYLEEDFNNILYVDDEESNLRVFDSVFSRYYNIYTANNGNTAINMLRENDIHMIITDQKMPEMTGTDLLESILEEFPDIIRIILTGFSDIQAIIKAINKCSIYKYITKPYENAEMREIIDKGMEIFNTRREKYKNGEENQPIDSAADLDLGLDLSNHGFRYSEESLSKMIKEVMLDDGDYEAYFDFHIDETVSEEPFGGIYADFVVNADEESTKLYFIVLEATADPEGALQYMFLKVKCRSILEEFGNGTDPIALSKHINGAFDQVELEFDSNKLSILSYDWSSGELEYLGRNADLAAFEIDKSLKSLKLEKGKKKHGDLHKYKVASENDMLVYFWSAQSDGEADHSEFFKTCVGSATKKPFDQQAKLINKSLAGESSKFTNAAMFALYLNDE